MQYRSDRDGLSYLLWRITWAPFWCLATIFKGPLGLTPPYHVYHQREAWTAGRFRRRPLHPRFVDWLRFITWPLALLWFPIRLLINALLERVTKRYPKLTLIQRAFYAREENTGSPPGTLKWWELYIFGSLRRVWARGHGEVQHVGIFLVGAFVSITGFLERFTEQWTTFLAYFFSLLYVAVPLIFILLCYTAYAALRRLPPEEYARVALVGRAEADVIRALAYEMLYGVREFREQIKELDAHLLSFGGPGNVSQCNSNQVIEGTLKKKESLRAKLKRYRHRNNEARQNRQRLLAMKEYAASVLGIPRRRLCDHVLNYSPATHEELALHYGNLWGGILRDGSDIGGAESALINNAKRCRWLADRFERFATGLEQLFRMVDVHDYVYRIASRHSTSGAVLEYAEALYHVFDRMDEAFHGRTPELSELRPFWSAAAEQLEFLFTKQKAYSGVNIHETCKKACDPHGDPGLEIFFSKVVKHGDLAAVADGLNGRDDVARVRDGLRRLRNTIDERIKTSRKEIVSLFMRDELPWLTKAGDKKAIIVTHGYSKTVRAVLSDSRLYDIDTLVTSTGEEDFEDARKMVFEVLENPADNKRRVVAGDERVLVGLVSPGDRVMALLGAECFDKVGRVIHPRGARDKITQLANLLDDQGVELRVVIVAEKYKFVTENLVTPFFRNFHERLDVYPPNLKKHIVTDARYMRLPVELRGEITFGEISDTCMIHNISKDGALVESKFHLKKGDMIALKLKRAGITVDLAMEVRFVSGTMSGAKEHRVTPGGMLHFFEELRKQASDSLH